MTDTFSDYQGGGTMPSPQGHGDNGGGDMQAPYVMGGANGAGRRRDDHKKLIAWISNPNIAEEIDGNLLGAIGQKVTQERELDYNTRADWERRSTTAMELAMQVTKVKQNPWPGASNIIFPLMTTAAVQFAARAYPAIVQGRNVVKGVVVGPDTGQPQISPQDGSPLVQMGPQGPQPIWAVPPGAKRMRADRIGDHMSWQLLSEMSEWEEETDKLLHILPIIGCVFRKSFYDPRLMCNASILVMPFDVVINYWAKSMERAPRVSEDIKYYPLEIEEMARARLFLDHDYGIAQGSNGDPDAPHQFVEQHRFLDLDDDGYAEPYVVTVHKDTDKVARIVARYDAEGVHVDRSSGEVMRIEPVQYFTKYDFLPNPEGGIYGVGFGQLLGPINEAVNTTLNMLFDAGHLQNTGGGFIGRGLSMHTGSVKFKLGEWKIVNAPGQTVRDSIVPMVHAGPSSVLFSLLGTLIDAGKEVASVKDALTGETAAASMQPTTLLALIEQGLKVFTAIYKRIHRSAKKEYDKLYRLNRIYLQHQARFQVGDEWKTVTQEDYARGAGVEPVSDPAMVSDMQKMARTQFLMGFANDPMMNGMEIRKEALTNAAVENPERFLNTQPAQPNPELLAKTAELGMKAHKLQADIDSEKAGQIRDISQAVLNLANADKAVGDQHLGWIEQHIDLLRLQLETLTQPATPPGPDGQAAMPGPPMGHPALARPIHPPQLPTDQGGNTDMSFHNGPFARAGAPPPGAGDLGS